MQMHLLAEASFQQVTGWISVAGLIGIGIATILWRLSDGGDGFVLPQCLLGSIMCALVDGAIWWMLRNP